MTITEAARQLGLSPATLRVQLRNGKLRGVKRGRDWWLTPAEVSRYGRENRAHTPSLLGPDDTDRCNNRSCIAGCRDKGGNR